MVTSREVTSTILIFHNLNGIRASNLDCMDGIKQFPDRLLKLAIVDLPYGVGRRG